jgi:hypothetical protein
MTLIPPPPTVSTADIHRWCELKKQLDVLKFQESELRKKLFGALIVNPKEGANEYALPDGYVFKATHVITRTVDQVQMSVLQTTKVRDGLHILRAAGYPDDQIAKMDPDAMLFTVLGLSVDKLIKFKPELSVAEYRKLTAEQTAVVNMFIDSKPGSPQCKLEPGKELKARLEAAAAPQAPSLVPPPPVK